MIGWLLKIVSLKTQELPLWGLGGLFLFTQISVAQSSVLSSGTWYKIGIVQSGVYKLTSADLQQMGIPVASIHPRNIRLYGNGGGMLPQLNSAFRPDDLLENSIFVEGETDGKFDASDYILFYGQGPHLIKYDSLTKRFSHQTHIYSDTAYYFLKLDSSPGKRIENQPSISGASQEIRVFDDYTFHEKDQYNVLQSGREWWGECFDAVTEQTISFDLPGIVPNQPARLALSVMAQSAASSQFLVKAAGQTVGSLALAPVTSGTYDLKGTTQTQSFTFTPTASPSVTLTFERSTGVGFLNWVGIQAQRELNLYGEQTTFRSLTSFSNSSLRYIVGNATARTRVWDISQILFPVNQEFKLQNSELTFEATGNKWKEFVVFNPDASLLKPVSHHAIPSQDLHSLASPNLLIISPSLFLKEAQRLAEFRHTHDGLTVAIVTPEQIYNEFSSGKQDLVAIRDFIRHLYQKSSGLRYVLLFGDASYDYKDRLPDNTNWIPVYESHQSLHPIFSYSSDDFLEFMEPHEGDRNETNSGDHTQEIAIGRLPIRNTSDAKTLVDKLIRYSQNPEALGDWRQNITFVADDGDGNTHQLDADRLANSIETNHKTYTPRKIFLDAYTQISYANGQKSPEAIGAIQQAVDKGSLIVNYTGHGSELGWAQEQILTIEQINQWKNANRMPLFVTATCEFGRYDNPEQISGAELTLLKASGGSIGLLTTTRPVFSSSNYAVNSAFYSSVFQPINGQMPRLGDIMKYTKNNSLSGSINRNFALLGDPSLRLAYPTQQAVVTTVNHKPYVNGQDTLKALSEVILEGEIRDANGHLLESFDGTLQATLFDKPNTSTTLGSESARMTFFQQNTILFKGKTSIQHGKFQVKFVIPKDIHYSISEGKLSLYAQQNDQVVDAAGATSILIGGSNPNPITDDTPPTMKLFMDDTTFVSGGKTSPNPTFIAKLADDNGINISNAGIGHDLLAILDDSVSIVLNDFFIASTNTYKQGEVRYSFQNLTPGKHRISLQTWDTHNNVATGSLEFVVVDSPFKIWNLRNYPNPVTQNTYFAFEHNRPGENMEVTIEVFNSNGQRVSTLQQTIPFAPATIDNIGWELTSTGFNKLAPGIYFYRVQARCIADSTTLAQKMVIAR